MTVFHQSDIAMWSHDQHKLWRHSSTNSSHGADAIQTRQMTEATVSSVESEKDEEPWPHFTHTQAYRDCFQNKTKKFKTL